MRGSTRLTNRTSYAVGHHLYTTAAAVVAKDVARCTEVFRPKLNCIFCSEIITGKLYTELQKHSLQKLLEQMAFFREFLPWMCHLDQIVNEHWVSRQGAFGSDLLRNLVNFIELKIMSKKMPESKLFRKALRSALKISYERAV